MNCIHFLSSISPKANLKLNLQPSIYSYSQINNPTPLRENSQELDSIIDDKNILSSPNI